MTIYSVTYTRTGPRATYSGQFNDHMVAYALAKIEAAMTPVDRFEGVGRN